MIENIKDNKIKLIIADVDGVLTDGTIIKGSDDLELKKFCVQDGTGVVMAKTVGIHLAVISGRFSIATKSRMDELNINDVYNGVLNKLIPYEELKIKYNLFDNQIAYIGDDLIDIPIMEKVGFSAAVQNAYPEVKEIADYITKSNGGEGAFREFVEFLLKSMGIYNLCLDLMRNNLINNS